MLLEISFVIHDSSMVLVTSKKCCFTFTGTNRRNPFISETRNSLIDVGHGLSLIRSDIKQTEQIQADRKQA